MWWLPVGKDTVAPDGFHQSMTVPIGYCAVFCVLASLNASFFELPIEDIIQ